MSEEEERSGTSVDRILGPMKDQNNKLWVCVFVRIAERNESIPMGRR